MLRDFGIDPVAGKGAPLIVKTASHKKDDLGDIGSYEGIDDTHFYVAVGGILASRTTKYKHKNIEELKTLNF